MSSFTSLGFKKIKDLKPGSVFLVEDESGEKFVLKQGPAAQRLVKFSQLVHQKGGELAEVMPTFFAQDGFFYQKFLNWQLAGDTVTTYGNKSEAFDIVTPEKLARVILALQTFPFADSGLDTRRADFYLRNRQEFKEALTREFNQDVFTKVEQFLFSQKDLVDKNSHFLANGDLHPQNIMYEKTEGAKPPPTPPKFILVDWDLLHLNNPGWDLTDLYVWGWRNRSWGERLLTEYRKVAPIPLSHFEQIFRFDVVYLTSQLIKHSRLIKAPKEFLEAQKRMLVEYLR